MRYQIDHDLHIHSQISPCSRDARQTKEAILAYGLTNHYKLLGVTDHFWDLQVDFGDAPGWTDVGEAKWAVLESLQDLLINGLVCLCKILSSLGVADDHILNANLGQHIGSDLAGVSTLLLEIHILGANLDVGTFCCLDHGDNVDRGYAEYYVHVVIGNQGL